MPEEPEDVESNSPNNPEVYQQTKFMTWFEKAFPWLLVSGAALGLTLMIILPIIFFQEKTGDQLKAQSDLRLALLYTTGGAIAALGLLETYRKNTNDRTKANADINAALKNQEHQTKVLKEQIRQFDENAFKERKAERRERYTKAVEQLGSKEAPVRMGGVYTLVGLVDEWLEEMNLGYSERLKEGQVIINNLCAYIRSPFTLASQYNELSQDTPTSEGMYKDREQFFYANKAILESEADVRLSVIKEIHNHLQKPEENPWRTWSDFEYDFSESTFFYPINLTNSHYKKPVNFNGSSYYKETDFSGSKYQDSVDFRDSTYKGSVDFRSSTYHGRVDFRSSTYEKDATFSTLNSPSTYQEKVNFNDSTYKGSVDFRSSTYHGRVDFRSSTYHGRVDFRDSIYQSLTDFSESTYQGWAVFRDSIYQSLTDFSDSIYQDWAVFRDSTYQGWAVFRDSTYQSKAVFRNSTYQDWAVFRDSTYQGQVDFSGSTYQNRVDFSDSTYHDGTDFSDSTYQS